MKKIFLNSVCAVFYQIQMLLGSSDLWFPQPLGNQLYASVAPSCKSFRYFSQPFCWFRHPSASQEALPLQSYYFSPQRETWNSLERKKDAKKLIQLKHLEKFTESHCKKSKTKCAVTSPLVAGGWRTRISLLLEPQVVWVGFCLFVCVCLCLFVCSLVFNEWQI